MASKQSYVITLANNKTEKQAVDYLLSVNKNFLLPDKNGRKEIIKKLNLATSYSRAFDLVLIEGHTNQENTIEVSDSEQIVLVEIKSTMKKLLNNPYGFFFGATENEFNLANEMGRNFKFCFVSLHPESISYTLFDLEELKPYIQHKRTQFQINLKSKQRQHAAHRTISVCAFQSQSNLNASPKPSSFHPSSPTACCMAAD